ncbi:MAG: phospho-sugar mutase [Clostridia bacterium]|nr:phospho-sugar mutase [Clostridia bacterium]
MNMYENYKKWLDSPIVDNDTKEELKAIVDNEKEVAARFAVPMEFGTAGLRSIMTAGTSRMNVYTVAHNTAGLAKLILDVGSAAASRGVAIAYDSRINSTLFARTAAEVLAANGIKVYFFDSLRPTPELSFAILELGCIAGINITASHNSKEYNGYKVYWEDGAQLPPDHAKVVSESVASMDIFEDVKRTDFDKAVSDGLIKIIGKEIDERYMEEILKCRICPEATEVFGDSLNIIYSPLHGAGYKLVPEVLKRAGITNLRIVPSQAEPDGNFPTVKSPNPENKECFADAINLAINDGGECDLMLATDPDSDRVGIVAKDSNGFYVPFSGNQVGALLIDYIIKGRREKNQLPENACAIKSVVSSELFDAVCAANGVKSMNVLTGFKYIGEKIKEFEQTGEHTFIFGYEESYGYLPGTYARDKDAVATSLLIAEMTAFYKKKGITLYEALTEAYEKYGYYKESGISIVVGGIDPMKTMREKMTALRGELFGEIAGIEVLRVRDYKSSTVTNMADGATSPTGLPASDMLYYELADGSMFIIRPSGTEPKIKVYILGKGTSDEDVKSKLEALTAFAKESI